MRLPHPAIALSLALGALGSPGLAQDAKKPPPTELTGDVSFVNASVPRRGRLRSTVRHSRRPGAVRMRGRQPTRTEGAR